MPSARLFFARIVLLLLAAVVAFGTPISDALAQGDARVRISKHEHEPDELLVKFREQAPARHAETAVRGEGAREVRSFKHQRRRIPARIDNWRVLKFAPGADIEKARTRLLKNRYIERVEYNYRVSIDLTPNDPLYPQLWGLHNTGQTAGKIDADIDAPEAWDVQTGNPGILVAVIDTGVDYNHPDLVANIWTNPGEIPGNGIDDDANGFIDDVHGYNFVANHGNPMDDHGHGTHVSGTIAASGNNGVGVVGVAWQARIMAVKFLDAGGGGTTAGAVQAVLYAAQMGAKVMNNSWGGGGFSQALADAIASADNAGALFVAAAGNSGSNNDLTPNYPSNYEVANVLAVAATDHSDAKASFSSFGATTVDLGAPGVNILSSVPTIGAACCSDPSGYKQLSGTSMATPHVAGAAALVFAQFPGITHHSVKDRLMTSAEPVASMQGITVTGGRLNIAAAFEDDTTPPAAVADLAVVNSGAYTVTLGWGATGDDGMTGSATSYDLRYSTAPIDAGNFNAATSAGLIPATGPAGTIESYTVQGLEPQTHYFFALKVRDNVGNPSPISNLVDATTKSVTVVFGDNFESGTAKWTTAGSDGLGGAALWHLSTHRSASPTTAFYYGKEDTLNYSTGARNFGSITSAAINLGSAKETMLTFNYFLATENFSPFDTARVQVSADNGVTWTDVFVTAQSSGGMVKKSIPLTAYDDKVIRLRFSFDTVDAGANSFEGWVVDDVVVAVGQIENDPTPPAPVTDLTAQAVTTASVTLGWTAPGDDGMVGTATFYDLRYATAPIDEANFANATAVPGVPAPSTAGTVQAFEVKNLASATLYYFALKSIDNVGNVSVLSNIASATTKAIAIGFDDNFESGSGNWTITGSDGVGGAALWHLSTHRFASPTTAFYYGKEATLNYNTGARNFGSITSNPIGLSTLKNSRLTFNHFLATENLSPFDTARVQVSADNGATWQDIFVTAVGTGGMVPVSLNLVAYDGKAILLRFSFDTVDGALNAFEGWVIDDVRVQGDPPAAAPPIANAGGPYTGVIGQAIQFNGAASSDPNGDALTYAWDFADGTTGTGAIPTHAYNARGTYTVSLVVNDGSFDSAPATTTVNIVNQPPVANAGGPYTGSKNIVVTLDGSASADADGDALTYSWDFGDGTGGTGVKPAHVYTVAGSYNVKLTVNDGQVNSAVATTTVTVANQPPVAHPGGPYTGQKSKSIAFNGTQSSDPNNDALTYRWDFGDGGALGNGPTPSHTYAKGGVYTVTLVVNDGTADSTAVNTTATVSNSPPTASLAGPFTVNKLAPLTFNGSGSSDADGDALTFNWTFGDGSVLANGGPNPAHAYATVGTYTVSLTVNDGETNSLPATTTVTVLNQSPAANAGPDQTVRQRTTVTLNAAASSDPDGTLAQFAWRQVSGTGVTLSGANTATPQFMAPSVRGQTSLRLVFEVKVTDNDGASAIDQVAITVTR